ncbi:MAG: outer membrane lipoprotein carrier protein LolA [Bacteroidia bacterium]|nr:outer membrane lipoprotein carrier protein LolA [Bacteroidia bacterium]
MRTLNILIAVLVLPIMLIAQKPVQKDKKADYVLKKVSERYSAYKTLRVEFSLTTENSRQGSREATNGTTWMKGDNYKLDLMDVETISDGKTIWSYQKKSNEVNISNRDTADKSFFNNPSRIFSGYDANFKYLYKGDEEVGQKTYCEIDLFPAALDKDAIQKGGNKTGYSRIRIKIDKTDYRIMNIKYFGKDGIDFTIELNRIGPNIPLESNFFSFDPSKHPGIEVIDLRE